MLKYFVARLKCMYNKLMNLNNSLTIEAPPLSLSVYGI